MAKVSWIGKALNGRYQIDELLGQGGMSAVYKATDPNLRRVVAVKMIHPHLSDNQDFIRRFEEEAAAVAQLRHPNIIQVFDFNHDEDTYFMVLEFVPGETLQDRLRRLNQQNRRMEQAQACEYIAQIADALQYAHERGMIHRDIKPANIMLDVYGKAILTDFGIARIMGGQRHTATGAVVGTALYMSPEQITGERADERSDIYSLGVTLFETLSGKPPFEADSAMTLMMMHMNDPAPDVRQLQPDVPAALAGLVQKSLAKKREMRFQKASEMAAALRQVAEQLRNPGAAAAGAGPAVEATVYNVPVEHTIIDEPPVHVRTGSTATQAAGGQHSAQHTQVETGSTGQRTVGQSDPHMQIPSSTSTGSRPGLNVHPAVWIGGAVGAFALVALVVVVLVITRFLSSGGQPPAQLVDDAATQTAVAETVVAAVIALTPDATETPAPTATPRLTNTYPAPTATYAPPADTPTATLQPTETVPPGPYARINKISVQDGAYVVEYETFEYTEQLPGMHVHFFFDTVAPEQAGVPGNGPWILYGGPRPFTKYKVTDRPYNANQMCALVANPNHSIQLNSGNCVDLPK